MSDLQKGSLNSFFRVLILRHPSENTANFQFARDIINYEHITNLDTFNLSLLIIIDYEKSMSLTLSVMLVWQIHLSLIYPNSLLTERNVVAM